MKNIIYVFIFLPALLTAQQNVDDRDIPTKDIIHADDVIIDGSLCVGLDCVDGEVWGFDTQRLKENNLRIHFDDTSTGTFPDNDWRIVINETTNNGKEYFAIEDATAGSLVFLVEANAPTNALYVHQSGRVGLSTDAPLGEMHIKHGDSPDIILEQDASSGFTPQTWELSGNEANFFVRDGTNNKLSFKIRPNAPTGSIVAEAGKLNFNQEGANIDIQMESDTEQNALFIEGTNGFVGIGTDTPSSNLHVVGDVAKTGSIVGASDKRIKTDISSIKNARLLINALDGKTFSYDQQKYGMLKLPEGPQYGLIAQEVEAVISDLVKKEFMTMILEDGTEETLMGVEYEQIIPILINAIKEQDRIISEQKGLISALEIKSNASEARLDRIESILSISKITGNTGEVKGESNMD